jgi:hypothetical protein
VYLLDRIIAVDCTSGSGEIIDVVAIRITLLAVIGLLGVDIR